MVCKCRVRIIMPYFKMTHRFIFFFYLCSHFFYTDLSSLDPIFWLLLIDFNVKSKTWYTNDHPTTEGTRLKFFTSLYGTKQLLVEVTHFPENFSSSIYLFLTYQSNVIMDSGVDLLSTRNPIIKLYTSKLI